MSLQSSTFGATGKFWQASSDRGSQYASEDFSELLKAHGIAPSVSRMGNGQDNARSETQSGKVREAKG